jgi:predicted transcriptional regulator YheO
VNHEGETVVFNQAIETADTLVKMLGRYSEVAVHNFHNLGNSLIHLAGSVTERKPGSPITNLVLQELKKPSSEITNMTNYKTVTNDGHVLKSSTVFLRNLQGDVIGALCINIDISLLIEIGGDIQDFITLEENEEKNENFHSNVQEVIVDMVDQVLQSFNKLPMLLSMEEKVECTKILDEKGAFLVKGCMEYLAERLNISKFTIYNYLNKIRSAK